MNSRIAKKVEKNAGAYDYQGRRVQVPVRRWDFSELVGGEIVIDRFATIILRDDGQVQRGGQYTMCDG